MREAVILAGGMATRLGDIAARVPKALLEVDGRPFIDHLAFNLRRYGVEHIVVAGGRLGEQVAAHVGDGARWSVTAQVVVEPEPLGTGGATVLASTAVSGDEFLLLNGDTLFDANYLDLALVRRRTGTTLAMALRKVDDAARYGAVCLADDGDNRVSAFAEKGVGGPGLINGGVYALAREALDGAPAGAFSLEHDLLPRLVASDRVAGAVYPGAFIDIGVPEAYEGADQALMTWRDKRMVLLDRDGVLNEDRGWVHRPDEFAWLPGAVQAVKSLNDAGVLVAVVTNQAGIARGLYSEEEYGVFERWIADRLAEQGAHLDAVYHCPHHPTEGAGVLTRVCECRKPAPGLILQALSDFGVSGDKAVFIGDSDKDMQAAENAGIRGVRYRGGNLASLVQEVIA